MSKRDYQAQRNRLLMPSVAAFVDEWRQVFPDLKVLHAKENGIEVGKPLTNDPDRVFVIPLDQIPARGEPQLGRTHVRQSRSKAR